MTISTNNIPDTYTGDGSTTGFAFTFQIEDESDIRVLVKDNNASPVTYTTKVLNTDYTVSGTGNTSGNTDYTSGTVTFTTAPATTDEIILDLGGISLTQSTDFIENSTISAAAIENQLDKIVLMIQQLNQRATQSVQVDAAETTFLPDIPDPTADYFLKANSSNTGFTWTALDTSTSGLSAVAGDTTPQLGGTLDTNAFDIEFDDGTGINSSETGKPELLLFTSVASAVNYFNITNSATTNPVILEAKGDDTDIGIDLLCKGAAAVSIKSDAGDPGVIRLYDDDDSNYIGFEAPAALSGDTSFVMPDGDGSANTMLLTNGSGTLSWSTLTGVAASQAEQETGTSTTVAVTPGRQHFHASACKGWIKADAAGGIGASYNVSSIVDDATGQITVNWDTDLSSSNYTVVWGYLDASAHLIGRVTSQLAGSTTLISINLTPTAADPTNHYIAVFGDI
jgi:hypothetical protein